MNGYWASDKDGAIILGKQQLKTAVKQKVSYAATVPAGYAIRFLFYYIDQNNYYCVEYDRGDNLFRIIRVAGGTETIVYGVSAESRADDLLDVQMLLCFDGCELRAEFYCLVYPNFVLERRFGYSNLGGACPPEEECAYAGFLIPSNEYSYYGDYYDEDRTYYVTGLTYLCDEECWQDCICCCDDCWGPQQMQAVISGFTGDCSVLNGTYILDRVAVTSEPCGWTWTNPSPGGSYYVTGVSVYTDCNMYPLGFGKGIEATISYVAPVWPYLCNVIWLEVPGVLGKWPCNDFDTDLTNIYLYSTGSCKVQPGVFHIASLN